MAPTGSPVSCDGASEAYACHKLKDELREIDGRLRSIVDAYEGKPSAIDGEVLNAVGHASDIEARIVDVYQIMKHRVYAEDSPLRKEHDVWDAFKEQEDEFIGFYKSALGALEAYQEVFRAYRLLKSEGGLQPWRGDLERIRQDAHAYIAERDGCIEAVSGFRDKYSAMLTILGPD
jgi:hypothetical protein